MVSKATRLRIKVLERLGGECAICGFSEWPALQIDHIHGNGRNDPLKKSGNTTYYKQLLNLPDLEESYQCLCANCNWMKRYFEGECYGTEPVDRGRYYWGLELD